MRAAWRKLKVFPKVFQTTGRKSIFADCSLMVACRAWLPERAGLWEHGGVAEVNL